MKIKLLSNGYGVLTERDPVVVNKELEVEINGASDSAEIVLEQIGGGACRREIKNGKTSIPWKSLEGEIRVTVLDRENLWECEELLGKRQAIGGLTVAPNDKKMPQTVAHLCIENDEMRRYIQELRKEVEETKELFKGICEGYNII